MQERLCFPVFPGGVQGDGVPVKAQTDPQKEEKNGSSAVSPL